MCAVCLYAIWTHYPVQHVRVYGDMRWLDPALFESTISPMLSAGFLGSSLGKVQSEISAIGGVLSADVMRTWPGDFVVQLHMREPFVRWGPRGFVDRTGALFYPQRAYNAARMMPELVVSLSMLHEGVQVMMQIQSVLQASVSLHILAVRYQPWRGWVLELKGPVVLLLGDEFLAARLRRWIQVSGQILGRSSKGVLVDLRYPDGFVVKR